MESSHQSRVMDNENAALALLLKLPKCGMRISLFIFLPSNLLQEKLGLCWTITSNRSPPVPSPSGRGSGPQRRINPEIST